MCISLIFKWEGVLYHISMIDDYKSAYLRIFNIPKLPGSFDSCGPIEGVLGGGGELTVIWTAIVHSSQHTHHRPFKYK